jgi:broad specificity phosphatase PhoE
MRVRRSIWCSLIVLALAAPRAAAQDALWSLMKGGGQVILIRHTITDPGVGDPPGMRLDDCSTQRNLSDAGRAHARKIGEAFRARGVAVERVLSSPWCRCLETARLAFGRAEVAQPLSNLFGRSERRTQQVNDLQPIVGGWGGNGNLVLVSHGATIVALTGVSPGTGEMVVVTPKGEGRFVVVGRVEVQP